MTTVFPISIRWRLQLWLAFLLVGLLSGFAATMYELQRVSQLRETDARLDRRRAAVSGALRSGSPSSTVDGARFLHHGDGNAFYVIAWSRDGAVAGRSLHAPVDVPRPERPDGAQSRTYRRKREGYREAYQFTDAGDCVLAGRSRAADLEAMARFKAWLFVAGGAVLAIGLGGGWWLTSRAVRPVEEISAAATRISAGHLSERIHVADPHSELGRLATVLNSTFTRLEAAFGRERRFTADASHELRTPLCVMIAEVQATLARRRSAAEYRDTAAGCLDTAQQMRRLIESLLVLARFDAGQAPGTPGPVDLSEHARATVDRIRPLAAGRTIEIRCHLAPAATFIDADRLGQLITNLLTNAVDYNRPAGEIAVRTFTEGGAAVLIVEDTGGGIAARDLPHVFERFYRADQSRSRADGRSGLGLAICKSIVDAAGGTVDVSSQPGAGTTVTVRLPGPVRRCS